MVPISGFSSVGTVMVWPQVYFVVLRASLQTTRETPRMSVWMPVTTTCAWVIAILLGSVVGVMRTTPSKWAQRIGNAWVELFRNIPLLVQLFLWYFVLPEVLPKGMGDALKQMAPPWGSFVPAVIGLGLFTSARVAEQVRSGINSLPRGQKNAGLAMGFTLPQVYRHVLLPMAYRIIMPPLTSEFLNIFKNSAVCSTIGLLELAAQGRQLVDYTAQPYESFIAVTLSYVLINVTVMTLMHKFERRIAVPGNGRSATREPRSGGRGGVRRDGPGRLGCSRRDVRRHGLRQWRRRSSDRPEVSSPLSPTQGCASCWRSRSPGTNGAIVWPSMRGLFATTWWCTP